MHVALTSESVRNGRMASTAKGVATPTYKKHFKSKDDYVQYTHVHDHYVYCTVIIVLAALTVLTLTIIKLCMYIPNFSKLFSAAALMLFTEEE